MISADAPDRSYLLGTAPIPYRPKLSVVEAEGSWLRLADGAKLLDLHGQHMCVGVGHRHPKLTEALHRAVDELDYAADFFVHTERERAARLLVEETMDAPSWVGGVRFVSSGSEATELAMIVARLFRNRPLIVTRDLAFHGWTSGASALTGIVALRNGLTLPDGTARPVPGAHAPYPAAPAPICAACPLGQTYPSCKDANGTLACVNATERVIRSAGVGQVAAFITEVWHGAGAFMVPDEYVPQIRALTTHLGILWIDDEAISGMGRTGRWWGFQHGDVHPDVVTSAKGLSSSAVPVGACLVSEEIAEFLSSSWWGHSSTFSGHPLAVTAVATTLEIMIEEELVPRAAMLGGLIEDRLKDIVARHPSVASYSGRGLVWGLELVRDPTTGERWVPADRLQNPGLDPVGSLSPAAAVTYECLKHGVFLFSYAPNTVTIAPPLRITAAEIELGLDTIDAALDRLDELT